MSEIMIRKAVIEDAEMILEYMKKIGGESDNLTYGSEGLPLSIEQEQAFLAEMQKDHHSVFLCAWKDNELVGTGNLSSMPRRMGHRAECAVSVLKKEWGKGIGSLIMNQLIAYAKENAIELINLEVRRDNLSAIHLYEKVGFKHIGTFPAFFKINDQYIDFELMVLDLRKFNRK